jgi:hypothetical protein
MCCWLSERDSSSGGLPVTSSKSTMPKAKTSLLGLVQPVEGDRGEAVPVRNPSRNQYTSWNLLESKDAALDTIGLVHIKTVSERGPPKSC